MRRNGPSAVVSVNARSLKTASDERVADCAPQVERLRHRQGIEPERPCRRLRFQTKAYDAVGLGNGSGRRRTALTTEKIAVGAPMPSASVSSATAANPGPARELRNARPASGRDQSRDPQVRIRGSTTQYDESFRQNNENFRVCELERSDGAMEREGDWICGGASA